jgi:hypothetical protein
MQKVLHRLVIFDRLVFRLDEMDLNKEFVMIHAHMISALLKNHIFLIIKLPSSSTINEEGRASVLKISKYVFEWGPDLHTYECRFVTIILVCDALSAQLGT